MESVRKVLIVDDDPVDREIFKRYLEDHEPGAFCFAETTLGESATDHCRAFRPDCVLLDFKLPDMDALSVLRTLRNESGELDVAVVMLTAFGNESVAVEAMKLGVMDYLPKGPTTAEALPRTIVNAIDRFRMRRQIADQRTALAQKNHDLEAIQRDLIAEKERYRLLTEAIPQLIWTATPDGYIEFANRRMAEYAGIETPGWDLKMIMGPEDHERYTQVWERANQTGNTFEIELGLVRASTGESRVHLIRAVPLPARDQTVGMWFGTCTDVDEQKRSEQALRQTQKLESIGVLAGGIAHDFNNILVGIVGAASLAVETIERTHPAQDMLRMVVESSERAAQLTQQLLAYAGKGESSPEIIDIPRLVRETAVLVRASIPRSTQLSVIEPDNGKLEVYANTAQVQQVIINLLINAGEAIGEGRSGLIAVRMQLQEIGAEDVPLNELGYVLSPGIYVALEISDTGCGMDERTRSRMFDPFFTTKLAGRGLGLASTQGIVRSLRGGIQVASAAGQGAVFRIWLPAAATPSAALQSQKTLPASQRQGRVLIVDDERVVRKTAEAALTRSGHIVMVAENGATAVQLLTEHAANLSLVLLDMNMPGESGVQVLKRLRQVHTTVPVVVMSGYGEREILEQFENLAILGFIQKPFTARTLSDRIARYLDAMETQSQHA